jgi:hypothetical protein
MHVPVSFRVVHLHADTHRHEVGLELIRHDIPQSTGGPNEPKAPPLVVGVLPEQFAALSIGREFDLTPATTAEASVGGNVLGQTTRGGYLGAIGEYAKDSRR